jgi:hypothetical protein
MLYEHRKAKAAKTTVVTLGINTVRSMCVSDYGVGVSISKLDNGSVHCVSGPYASHWGVKSMSSDSGKASLTDAEKSDKRINGERYASAAIEIADAIKHSDELNEKFTGVKGSRLQIIHASSKVRDQWAKELREMDAKLEALTAEAASRDAKISMVGIVHHSKSLNVSAIFFDGAGTDSCTPITKFLKENAERLNHKKVVVTIKALEAARPSSEATEKFDDTHEIKQKDYNEVRSEK